MRCPVCELDAPWRELHRHLADAHPELVSFEYRDGRSSYRLTCPVCGVGYEQAIKPRLLDPEFLAEYETEIRLVGLDMLLNHLVGEHLDEPDQDPVQPASGEVS